MRNITPRRNLGDHRPLDVQYLVDDNPTMVSVYRKAGSAIRGERQEGYIGEFQCRIEPLAMGPRYLEERDRHGNVVNLTNRLLALPTTDKFGNSVDIKHGDTVKVDTTEYRVLYVNRMTYMTEAIIETGQ